MNAALLDRLKTRDPTTIADLHPDLVTIDGKRVGTRFDELAQRCFGDPNGPHYLEGPWPHFGHLPPDRRAYWIADKVGDAGCLVTRLSPTLYRVRTLEFEEGAWIFSDTRIQIMGARFLTLHGDAPRHPGCNRCCDALAHARAAAVFLMIGW